MTEATSDPLPPLRPQQKHARLAVDTFCVECGYNLHSQEVTRDERLGIFVCRCPECGRFHPAGVGMTATSVWMQRLATILLIFWVLMVLHAIFWIVMGMGAVMVAHVEILSYRKWVTLEGQELELIRNTGQWVIKGTTQPVMPRRMVRTLEPQENWYRPGWEERTILLVGGTAIGFVTGVLMVVFLWHWKKRRYLWTLLLPLACAGFVSTVFAVDDEYELIRAWAIRIAFSYAALEAASMILGMLVGRPIVRGLLRMFVPPRARQHFAFLWRCDGKAMPAAGG
jgi:hypothetical protein